MTKNRTEVTIERHRVITIRNANLIDPARCPTCGRSDLDRYPASIQELISPQKLLEERTPTKGEDKQ